MAPNISQRILEREVLRSHTANSSYRSLYSSKRFVEDLDIVNELDGHSGCVNALSWSKSGRLLASGSDDRHLNIHAYQPDDSTKQFQLRTTVATGHTENIFSVKFMPHSSDRTVVTCAGDADVRVFDLEYTGPATAASQASSMATSGRHRRRDNVFAGVRYLSDGDTNARVYRCHADRAKRVVTEDSPYLFLTCSEDGEVRQWDTRQPSSYYPRPRGNIYVPPPLISYRRFNVDLNTISCSGSQPHYIALGGSHLHCFLHDRRMAGRDRTRESGRPASASSMHADENVMTEATRCVRRFGPGRTKKDKRSDRGHITACKISDARPNELIVSWSQDNIYSFDMVRSPDAVTVAYEPTSTADAPLKRKRAVTRASDSSLQKPASKHTTRHSRKTGSALRIHYENGQQEDIPIKDDETPRSSSEHKAARRITTSIISICKGMFDSKESEVDRVKRFTKTLGEAAAILSDIDECIRTWSYPLNPSTEEVVTQKKLKRVREQARRFVQTAGVLSRVLGGRLQTASSGSPLLAQFLTIETKDHDRDLLQNERFGYDFIKAIILWLESGPGMLIEGFTRPTNVRADSKLGLRLPIPEAEATLESLSDHLQSYLEGLAGSSCILDLDTNRFLSQRHRLLYPTAVEAIQDLFTKIDQPFRDSLPEEFEVEHDQALDRLEMQDHWAFKVARGLLHQAFLPLDLAALDIAFGGTGLLPTGLYREVHDLFDLALDDDEADRLELIEGDDEEKPQSEDTALGDGVESSNQDDGVDVLDPTDIADDDNNGKDDSTDMLSSDDNDDDAVEEDDEDEDSSEPDEIDGVPYSSLRFVGFLSERQRQRDRAKRIVGSGVPCDGYVQAYKGHCNVQTVKDVNYYGLDDEYVVSGSDDGNFFIWDSKSGELVNILEGDGEIVNVIQGHPYEPMLAVSGIDHTIKIFSPDHRARTVARLGQGVSAHDPSSFSSLAWPYRLSRRRRAAEDDETEGISVETAATAAADEQDVPVDVEDDTFVAPHGLRSRQRMAMHSAITAMNAEKLRRGDNDSMITSSYLRLVARHLRAQRAAGTDAGPTNINMPGGTSLEEDEDGRVRIVLGDECSMM